MKPKPKPKGNIRIDVFVTPYQKEWLEKDAKNRGVSVAEMTRRLLDKAIEDSK